MMLRSLVICGILSLTQVVPGSALADPALTKPFSNTEPPKRAGSVSSAPAKKIGFMSRVHVTADGSRHDFIVFIPYHYDPAKPSPVILFLHGGGERGDNNIDQVLVGLAPAIMKNRSKFPFVTVFPQCPREKDWKAGDAPAELALAMLKQVESEFKTDPDRVYMTGLSMGGEGSWTIAAQHPDQFAAIVPMCAAPDPKLASKLATARIPIWNFCGDKDSEKTLKANREMAAALTKAGAIHKYTEVLDAGHNCWDAAYAMPALYTWMLEHSRFSKKQP